MANSFDKNKQPIEWLLEEIKSAQDNTQVIQLLEAIRDKPTSPVVQKSTIVLFNTPLQFNQFWSNLPWGKTLHVVKMVFNNLVNADKSTPYLSYYSNTSNTDISFLPSSVTLGYSTGTPSSVDNRQLSIENVKLKRDPGTVVANTTGSIYLEYLLID